MSIEDRRSAFNDALNGSDGIDFTALEGNDNGLDLGVPVFLPPELEQRIEFKIGGTTIHLDQNGNFSGINEFGEIVRGEELKNITRQALESGYFQLNYFDTETIAIIDKAVYGKNTGKQINR